MIVHEKINCNKEGDVTAIVTPFVGEVYVNKVEG